MEVESFEAGTLLKILVKPGVSVPVQTTVGFLGQPGEPVPEVAPPPAPPPVAGSQSPAKAAEVQRQPRGRLRRARPCRVRLRVHDPRFKSRSWLRLRPLRPRPPGFGSARAPRRSRATR